MNREDLQHSNKAEGGNMDAADFKFECKRCGRCCGLTPFTRSDYKRVRRQAEKLRVPFVKQSIEGHTVYFVRSIVEKALQAGDINKVSPKDIICPFLEYDEKKKSSCKIYDDRPSVCRMFGTEGWRGFYLNCPYQNETGSGAEKKNA
jgi:Fe-S-cluster containining protein